MRRAFVSIVILAAVLRFYGLNWDHGYHLHPDERWLTMVVGQISWPQGLSEFLSIDSPLNPKFFAYGSLPIYLLRFAGNVVGLVVPQFAQYNSLNLLGRMTSVFFDLGTLVLVYFLGRKIWNEKVGLLASFFYAIAVFPIQNAHFYTVDIQLTFWITLTLWLLTKFADPPKADESRDLKTAVGIGIALGAALATKVTAVFLSPSVLLALGLIGVRGFRGIRELIKELVFIFGVAFFTFVIAQPYALIDFHRFKSDVLLQSQMSRDATVFPYTIQYVGTTPYVYQLKNLVLWGLGVPLGIFGVLGILGLTIQAARQVANHHPACAGRPPTTAPANASRSDVGRANHQLVLLSFFWFYFIVMGISAVKFMRYLLPLYPLLTLSAAYLFFYLWTKKFNFASMNHIIEIGLIGVAIVYTISFVSIYSCPHTRVTASSWINQNIPAGSALATEHWDDELPLWGGENFKRVKLNLYDPDNAEKVNELVNKIVQADYIILSSNRLYDSIPKLPERYPVTIHYYRLLFTEKLGFKKIAEFTSYPKFSIFNFQFSIRDEGADESFTVYDHPKVMVFQKMGYFSEEKLDSLLRL